jgi:hypothetical protein
MHVTDMWQQLCQLALPCCRSFSAANAAAGNTSLLVESSSYLAQHWLQEAQWASPSYYWPSSHDNVAWPAAIMLLGQLQRQQADPEVTAATAAIEQHQQALSHMFRGWMTGKVGLVGWSVGHLVCRSCSFGQVLCRCPHATSCNMIATVGKLFTWFCP